MTPAFSISAVLAIATTVILVVVGWRGASRVFSLPCPSAFGWALESPLYERLTGAETIVDRIGLKPGQRVLEIGPGPGRLLIPAARRVLPGGQVVGIDIQPGMVERLKRRANAANITNLVALLGDATQPIVDEQAFDVVIVATTLGEIPNREAALAQCFRALKSGGILSINEMLPDPHYQSRTAVKRLAQAAGFQLQSVYGGLWSFTANFVKP